MAGVGSRPAPKVFRGKRNYKESRPLAMSLIVWNARGICSSERQNELKNLCAEKSIEIIIILETKTKTEGFNFVSEKMRIEWNIIRNVEGEDWNFIWLR